MQNLPMVEKQSHNYTAVATDPEADVTPPISHPSRGDGHITFLLLL